MTIERVLEAARNSANGDRATLSRIDDINWSSDYAEPGYSAENGVLFANWNDIDVYRDGERHTVNTVMSRLLRIFEKMGVECEWSDEWSTCDDCGKAIRTSPDSYGWTPSYHCDESGTVCHNCIDHSDYVDSLVNKPGSAVTLDVDLNAEGFEMIQDRFENGLHQGMDDNPKAIFKQLELVWEEIVFKIDEQSQFYTGFSVWARGCRSLSEVTR